MVIVVILVYLQKWFNTLFCCQQQVRNNGNDIMLNGLTPKNVVKINNLNIMSLLPEFVPIPTPRCICQDHLFSFPMNGHCSPFKGAGRSSEVERSLMVRWVVGPILHGVDPLSYFSFQPVLHYWCNKRPWYVLSCLWDGAYKRTVAVNR